MKKVYSLITLLLLTLFIGGFNVNATIIKKIDFNKTLGVSSADLDQDDIINFPMTVWNGEGEITIDSSITNYTMYYQWIELTSDEINALENAKNTYKNKSDEVKEELDRLYAKYEAKYKIYEDLSESGTATTDELNAARDAASAEYDIYKNYYDTMMVELDTLYEDYYKIIPDYTSNWTKADNNEFKGDFSSFSDERQFVLWIRLDYANKSAYDFGVLTVNGTYEDEVDDTDYQSYWEEFVEKFKTVKSMEGLLDLSSNDAYTVTNTASELKIVYTGNDNLTITTIFTHEKGIVKYQPNDDEEAVLVDGMLITHAITALAEMKGYKLDEFIGWLEAQGGNELTLATHGIEFTTEPYNYSESSDGSSVNIDTVKYTKFMIDIANGVKYSNSGVNDNLNQNADATVESPKTGIVTYTIAIVGGALLAGGTYYYLRKKNILKKI